MKNTRNDERGGHRENSVRLTKINVTTLVRIMRVKRSSPWLGHDECENPFADEIK
jgi:hypothetical protein